MLEYIEIFCIFGGFPFGILGYIMSMVSSNRKVIRVGYALEILTMLLAVVGVVMLICMYTSKNVS